MLLQYKIEMGADEQPLLPTTRSVIFPKITLSKDFLAMSFICSLNM